MLEKVDVIVIGAGMAGASAGYELSRVGRVVVLEQESQPGHHATGRSAAMFLETYGNATIRGLTCGSRAFYEAAPSTFGGEPVLSPRGALFIAGEDADERRMLEAHFDGVRQLVSSVRWVEGGELHGLAPCLAPGRWTAGAHEPEARDLDVHAIHNGFLRGLKANGGSLVLSAPVQALGRVQGDWHAETPAGTFSAPVVVNASGAWGDHLADLAGVPRVGLRPKQRTGVIVDAPPTVDARALPYVGDIAETFYIKPEGTRLFVSPCDETDVAPYDAIPGEYDIAVAMHRLEEATTVRVHKLSGKLAGLRSFVADRTPVVGFGADGFFWLVGQGGYGIQTAPAMSRVCAALVRGHAIPDDLQDLGVDGSALSPHRPTLALPQLALTDPLLPTPTCQPREPHP